MLDSNLTDRWPSGRIREHARRDSPSRAAEISPAAPAKFRDSLHVTHVILSLDVGGLERGLINQIREGLKLGERISVICLERPGMLASHLTTLEVPILCLEKRPGIQLSLIGRLKRIFRDFRPDVVHTHQIGGLFYAGSAARRASVPVIVHTEHGKENYAGSLRRRWLGRLSGRYAARVFCLSEDLAKTLRQNRIVPAHKIVVIPNGIDTSRFQACGRGPALRQALGIPARSPVVGTVARLTEIKRQDVLIRGFAKLAAKMPETHLLVVGAGPLMDSLRCLAADLELQSRVHFIGHQAEPEPHYEVMDVFALTSRSEGMPQTIMEAFAAGVPVVASRVGGIPEMVEDDRSGLLFTAGDEEGLAHALGKVLRNPELARRLREAARERVEEKFHVRRMAADYHGHFVELLGWETQVKP
jgi:sugar transferase (PEP-CTERM/EpsH1 system associated)